jgi:2-C-methyl-D-erythritol 4-phosphate cytidylyltransferase
MEAVFGAMSDTYAVIPAAGRGLRMGLSKPKQFLQLSGKPILAHTIETFMQAGFFAGLCLVVPEDHIPETERLIRHMNTGPFSLAVVPGGAERQDSVYNGLQQLPSRCGWVVIHDGVRPFVSARLLRATWESARRTGAAIAALPATDTIKRVENGHVRETLPRDEIWQAQTPQAFGREIILAAYQEAARNGWKGTDDASFVERMGIPVSVVCGESANIKVTTPEDLEWAAWHLSRRPGMSEAMEADECV